MNLPLLNRTRFLSALIAAALLLVAFECEKDDGGQPPKIEKTVVPPKTVLVQGGAYVMGRAANIDGYMYEPYKAHPVTVSDFYLGQFEVTVAEYRAFCEDTRREMPVFVPEEGGDRQPIIDVDHDDAVAYCQWLSNKTGKQWRLPTEAEWEYAARGGKESKGYSYAGGNDYNLVGWYDANSGSPNRSHPVGSKLPNELNIYDMSGNVEEWCADWYDEDYYAISPSSNPQGPTSGLYRVYRGGSNFTGLYNGFTLVRQGDQPYNSRMYRGFRVARTP